MNNWPIKKLGEVAIINPPKSEVSSIAVGTAVSFVSMASISPQSGTITNIENRNIEDVRKGYTYFANNDVLFAKITPCMENGKVVIANNLQNGIGFGTTEVHVLRPTSQVLPEWIYSIVSNKQFRTDAKRHMTGTAGQQRVPKEYLENFKIPIPPKNEQKKIVDKLEKIFKPQRSVNEQLNSIDELFNSVCLTTFSKIQADYEEFILSEVCDIAKGKFPTLKTPEGQYPFVVTAEFRRTANDFQFDTAAVCIPLVSSTGHGHADIKRIHYQEGRFALANIMVALIPKNQNNLVPKFLYYYLSFYKDKLLIPLMSGSANVTIPIDSLKYIKIPLPTIKLQMEVINKLSKIEELKKILHERKKLLEALQQSVLHQAFQGEL